MSKVLKTAHDLEEKWRSKDVQLEEKADFSTLLLKDRVLSGLKKAGYKTPSPIQVMAIPPGVFGKDLLVQAKSGTGKTLVFAIVALQSLLDIKYPQVLIMVPTREIAVQVRDCFRAVGSGIKDLKCCSFIGGLPISDDEENIVDCQIVVGTPGRLKQLISIGYLKTNSIRLLVLDEADTLIENVFISDLNYIFQSLPKAKQVIATSATYPKELKTFIHHYFRVDVFKARLNIKDLSLLGMIHYIKVVQRSKLVVISYKAKLSVLEQALTSVRFRQCLVFCNLKTLVETLCCDIRKWGFTTTYISADKEQHARLKAIDNLKRFRCKVLVSSDVTARGIDAENVDLVINFDKPYKEETYFHRCGRAGRYGSKGVAITLLFEDEVDVFRSQIENKKFHIYILPDPIPKNLINIRPLEQKPAEIKDASDIEEQENSLDVISDVTIQNEFEENAEQISKVKPTEQNEKNVLRDTVDGVNHENKESYVIVRQNKSDKSDMILKNGFSNDSEQITTDITEESSFKSNCEGEVNELHLKSTSDKSVVNVSLIEIESVDGNSSNLAKECTTKDFYHNSLSKSPLNTSSELKTMLEQVNGTNNCKADQEESFEINEKLEESGYKKKLESNQISDQVNNSCQNIASDSAQTQHVKVNNFSKMQISLAKFLVDYEVKGDTENISDLNKCETLCNSLSSTREKETFPFKCDKIITEKYKHIRKDLADFYHKVYESYQVQSIDEASFKDLKATLNDAKENKTSEINREETDITLDEHSYTIIHNMELPSNDKKISKMLPNKNNFDDSAESSDSTQSENKLQSSLNSGDQTFENYIFKCKDASKNIPKKTSESDRDSSSSTSSDSSSSSSDSSSSSSESGSSCSKSGSFCSKSCSSTSDSGSSTSDSGSSSSDSDSSSSDSHTEKNSHTFNKLSHVRNLVSSSSGSEKDSFCSRSQKLPSKACKVSKKGNSKSFCENKIEKYDIPSETLSKQDIDTSRQGVRKKAYTKNIKNSCKNENRSYFLGSKKHLCSQNHNETRTIRRNSTTFRSDVSHSQEFNKSLYTSKNKEQKESFRNEYHENSKSCNCSRNRTSVFYPYTHQYHEYFPTVPQVPVLPSVYSYHQSPCCIGNISCNNMPGDLNNIFLKQWEFIQNYCYPKY